MDTPQKPRLAVNHANYLLVYVLTAVAVSLLGAVLNSFAKISLGGGVGTVVPAIMAALTQGTRYARVTGEMAPKGLVWRLSVIWVLMVLVLNIAFFFALMALDGGSGALRSFANAGGIVFSAVILLITLLLIPVNYFFFNMGAKGELKAGK